MMSDECHHLTADSSPDSQESLKRHNLQALEQLHISERTEPQSKRPRVMEEGASLHFPHDCSQGKEFIDVSCFTTL